jgi:hypothetical protein
MSSELHFTSINDIGEACITFCTGACEPGSRCRPNECIFGKEKPRGVGNLGLGVYEQGGELGSSVYKQSETRVDGSCHSKEGSK